MPGQRGLDRLKRTGCEHRQHDAVAMPAHRPERRAALSVGRGRRVDVGVMATAVDVFDVQPEADREGIGTSLHYDGDSLAVRADRKRADGGRGARNGGLIYSW